MLPEQLAESVRAVGEANGGSLLVDAGRGRALLTDAARVVDVCRGLKRSGFVRFVDFTGQHIGAESFAFFFTLRAPAHSHARFTLKWKWSAADSGREHAGTEAHTPYNPESGAGQPGDELQAGPVPQGGIHPSLSAIWPAAGIAEREVFEMLGVPFAGNPLEPLLLDESFVGFPLRRDYTFTPDESFATKLLRQRHAGALITALRATVGTQLAASADAASSVPTAEHFTEARND